ncbi:MAG: hypothetical protein QNK36_10425 [Colwellia sp.]|nr:hypothetical protein [Colwellia sp.]
MTQHNTSKRRNRASKKENEVFNNLLKGMDSGVVESFTPKQLNAIKAAINIREWRTHSVDFRPTLALPFIPWNFYVVFLFGVNRRGLSTSEKFVATAMFLLVIFFTGMTLFALVFIILYLFKSWLGIDVFPESSLGLWDEFKAFFG